MLVLRSIPIIRLAPAICAPITADKT
ncbi:hypothetical protein YPPY99_1892, partial [Yersinia pestis PY-99]